MIPMRLRSRLTPLFFALAFAFASAATALVAAGCQSRTAGPAASGNQTSPANPAIKDALVGRWLLRAAAGKTLPELSIKTYRMHFGAHGQFTYEARMTGVFDGSDFKGEGSYRIEGDRLLWNAADHTGSARIELHGDDLTLDPDPILAPDGKNPVTANYHRE